MRKLTFRQIETFLAVMNAGSISGGADVLRLTQPAVSRSIKDLEGNLRLRLFSRKGNSIRPTAEAVILVREVEAQFTGLDKIEEVASYIRDAQRGTLRVSSMLVAATRFVPFIISEYLNRFPDAHVTLDHASSKAVIEAVSNRRADIGVCHVTEENSNVQAEFVSVPTVMAVVPAGHPLANQDVISIESLADTPLLKASGSPIWDQISGTFLARGIKPRVVCEASAAESLYSLAALGVGIAITSPFNCFGLTSPKVVLKPLSEVFSYGISIILPNIDPQPKPVMQFASIIRNGLKGLASGNMTHNSIKSVFR